MKMLTKLLMMGTMGMVCCSVARAQFSYSNACSGGILIYSNSFTGGAVDITGTTPTYINPNAAAYGGSNDATFYVVTNNVTTGSYGYQDGTLGTHLNSVLLPLNLTNGYVYNLAATLTFRVTPPAGGWGGIGYAAQFPVGKGVSDARISGLGANNPWTLLNMFANGQGAILEANNAGRGNVPNLMNSLNTPYLINLLVDTTTTNWTVAEYIAGTLIGTYTYAVHPTVLSVGYTQTTTTAGAFQWGPIAVSAVPLVITKEPGPANANEGSIYTNTVVAGGQAPFFYQWYTNGVAIGDATNASLVLNPVSAYETDTNYTVVVTNVYGAVTSTPASLFVYTSPQFLSVAPITYTNLMTLFGGSGSYLGSSPSFSVGVGGAQPLGYFWLTNGVAVGGANGTNFIFNNCQMDSPTSFSCIVSNSYNTATNTWLAQYIPTPTAPYPQLVLTDAPAAFWRLDETNIDQVLFENNGEICDDFMSGNNGIYTNVALAQSPGYFVVSNGVDVVTDSNQTAAYFGPPLPVPGEAFSVGTNVDFSAYSNAEFTVSVWANGGYLGDNLPEPANGGIVAKGGFGTEEFALDDGGSGGAVRFMVRNAANVLSGASGTLKLGGDDNWHLLVGVCDESNGVVNLYVDGLLSVQTTITKGSGLLPSASAPITIGSDGGGQFNGGLDDVAIFPYALNADQVNALYKSSGGVNPLTFTAPVPPTNVVWRVNQTLTIPATALGLPPLGYYWTNVTAGGILSGAGIRGGTGTSVVSTITCTLTITNAGQSWSGDQLELVVTNATSSTNLFVTLFAYPPPITIDYTNSILYSNVFNGGSWNLAGTAPTEVNSLVGGTNSTWTDVLGTNDTTGQNGTGPGNLQGSGLDNCALGNSWIFPFTPQPGFIYTETATVTFNPAPGNWVGEGFAQHYVSNTLAARFDDNGPNGMDWILMQPNGNAEFIDGIDNSFVTNQNGFYNTTPNTPHTMVVVLDTTQPQWAQYAWIDGVSAGTNVFSSNPTIGSVGITQNAVGNNPNTITWNSWSLTAVSPNGFAPYLITASPPGSIQMTNSTITVPATGYGTGPWGYYWSNNNTIIASGTTNDSAPNVVSLSVPASSLSAGPLDLVMTNAIGTNITVITLVSPINPNPTNIVTQVTSGGLSLSWPADHTGWQLQAQTNSASVGLSSNWVNVTGSTSTNQVVIPVNPNNGTVFYRLMYNP